MIKPKDCLTELDKTQLATLENKVDDYLRTRYTGEKRLYLGGVIMLSEGKLRTAIIERYKANGWSVWFVPSSVDGMPEGPYFADATREDLKK